VETAAYKRGQSTSPNLATFDSEAASLELCSTYHLFPQERVLFRKYYQNGQRVLDLACGAGRATLRLWEMGLAVKGIDLSEFRLATAQRRFPYLDFELGDYCELHESDESFDHVLI
jgi:ubiquinone/menaquinone biosynthesis C-methylase UbiE